MLALVAVEKKEPDGRNRRGCTSIIPWRSRRSTRTCVNGAAANRTIVDAFAARPTTLRAPEPSPLEPERLPKHVRYRCATPRRIRAWIGTQRIPIATRSDLQRSHRTRRLDECRTPVVPGCYLLRSQRSTSARSTMPSTRTTWSASRTSYITRWSPMRDRWKTPSVPRMVFTDLPGTRPGWPTSPARRLSPVRMR